jgi:hypothetical protein
MEIREKQRLFGFQVLQQGGPGRGIPVRGSCMEPFLAHGQKVDLEIPPFYMPGDLVAALLPGGRPVIHRMVGYRKQGGRRVLILKADASRTCDPPIPIAQVLGRVKGSRPSWRQRARSLGTFLKICLP